MNRPLETTFWMRFKQFVKGVFLYNTIYWRRASDDLDIKRMSREERASLRPQRNLEIIRPRENPRPTNGSVVSLPTAAGQPFVSGSEVREPADPAGESPRDTPGADGDGVVEIHRRRKRRRGRHSQVTPKRHYESGGGGGGMFGWLFKK